MKPNKEPSDQMVPFQSQPQFVLQRNSLGLARGRLESLKPLCFGLGGGWVCEALVKHISKVAHPSLVS